MSRDIAVVVGMRFVRLRGLLIIAALLLSAIAGCAAGDTVPASTPRAETATPQPSATAPARTGAVFDGNLPVDRSTSSGQPAALPAPTFTPSAVPTAAATPTRSAPTPVPTSTTAPTAVPTVAKAGSADSGAAAATGETGPAPSGAIAPLPQPAAPSAPLSWTKRAADRVKVIALDPGHGGPEPGASAAGLTEKDLNLRIGLKLAALLRDEGYKVVMTRETDRSVSAEYRGAGYAGGLGGDLQARINIANAAAADLFLSIHNNGSNDSSQAGTEVWYNRQRTFADRNLALAKLLQSNIVARIRELGYPAFDRGIKDDSAFRVFQGRAYNIYVLGPGEGPRAHVPTQMPGALGESLIVSNPGDAAMLRKDSTLDAIARGYLDAVNEFFRQFPE